MLLLLFFLDRRKGLTCKLVHLEKTRLTKLKCLVEKTVKT